MLVVIAINITISAMVRRVIGWPVWCLSTTRNPVALLIKCEQMAFQSYATAGCLYSVDGGVTPE